jgi:hypothetical protein
MHVDASLAFIQNEEIAIQIRLAVLGSGQIADGGFSQKVPNPSLVCYRPIGTADLGARAIGVVSSHGFPIAYGHVVPESGESVPCIVQADGREGQVR